jgi:hypothetical protein
VPPLMSNVMRPRNPLHRPISGLPATTVAKVPAREGMSVVSEQLAPHAGPSSLFASGVPLHRGVHRWPASERARKPHLARLPRLGGNARASALATRCSCGARRALRRAAACGFVHPGSRLGYAALPATGRAFVGGAAHNRSLERTPDGAAQLQR